jgi:hypothetical protein
MKKLIAIVIATVVVVGGGTFFGGMKYGESKNLRGQFSRADFQNLSPEERQQRLQQRGAGADGFRGGQRSEGGFVTGEILSKDDKSITIKILDGGSKIVFFSDKTEIVKSVGGTPSDLEVGKNVTANGMANSDGSITAQTIQLRYVVRQNKN